MSFNGLTTGNDIIVSHTTIIAVADRQGKCHHFCVKKGEEDRNYVIGYDIHDTTQAWPVLMIYPDGVSKYD